MKTHKTFFLAFLTVLVIIITYFFDYKAEKNVSETEQALILNLPAVQISYVQIIRGDLKIGLQKSELGWSLLEPFQDFGDNLNIEEFLNKLTNERQITIVKQMKIDFTEAELKAFGLDKPATVVSIKNNLGVTKKIDIGSVKNYEGNSYIRIDSENKIILAGSFWSEIAEYELMHYRQKKLYRDSLANITRVKIKSLQDEFELKLIDGKWINFKPEIVLDQNKVRGLLKKISEINIEQYVFEGEPSSKLIFEKGLDKKPVYLEVQTENDRWSVVLNANTSDNALYALTERPTFIAKVEMSAWEALGSLNLDGLRDRLSAMAFDINEVKKIYYKVNGHELNFSIDGSNWVVNSVAASTEKIDSEQIKKIISKVHDLKVSEFIDNKEAQNKFDGKNMLIFKSASEKLILQLNWGPSFKIKKAGKIEDYYYVRTNLSKIIFALEKNLIDTLIEAKVE